MAEKKPLKENLGRQTPKGKTWFKKVSKVMLESLRKESMKDSKES